jgi:hypothetical protein
MGPQAQEIAHVRLVLGLIKGTVIGGLLGLAAYQLGWTGGLHWLTYGLVGFMVGLLVGRPIWSHLIDKNSTVVVSVLKGIVGYGIGIGIYALVAKAWGGGGDFQLMGEGERVIYDWQPLFGAIVGAIYGAWVEVDDAPPAEPKAKTGAKTGAKTEAKS